MPAPPPRTPQYVASARRRSRSYSPRPPRSQARTRSSSPPPPRTNHRGDRHDDSHRDWRTDEPHNPQYSTRDSNNGDNIGAHRRHRRPSTPSLDLAPDDQAEIDADPDADDTDVSRTVREQYDELIEHLKASKTGRWTVAHTPGSPLVPLQKTARLVLRMHGPHLPTTHAIAMGLTICAAPSLEEACKRSLALRECLESERAIYVKAATWLLERVPYLRPMLALFEERPLDLVLLSNFVDHHSRQGRTADISTLKENMHKWIPTVTVTNPLDDNDMPIVITPRIQGVFDGQRINWGWNSMWSACLLIWRKLRDEFDRDPHGYLERLQNGTLKINEAGFPSFLYDETSTVTERKKGLFQGLLHLKAFRCIWTSPESSDKKPGIGGSGRPSISQANGVDKVEPEMIAYIACLIRHILSSESTWKMQDPRLFNSSNFFNKMLGALSIEQIKTPVLAFYQYNVYGTIPGSTDGEDGPDDDLTALRKEFEPTQDVRVTVAAS